MKKPNEERVLKAKMKLSKALVKFCDDVAKAGPAPEQLRSDIRSPAIILCNRLAEDVHEDVTLQVKLWACSDWLDGHRR